MTYELVDSAADTGGDNVGSGSCKTSSSSDSPSSTGSASKTLLDANDGRPSGGWGRLMV